jgi:hypothetical protein
MLQPAEQLHVVGPQLGRCPRSDRVGNRRGAAAGQRDKFPVGVAPHPGDPLAKRDEPVEDRHRLRTGRDVAGEHDPLRTSDVGLGQHRLERRQDAVDIGQHRH